MFCSEYTCVSFLYLLNYRCLWITFIYQSDSVSNSTDCKVYRCFCSSNQCTFFNVAFLLHQFQICLLLLFLWAKFFHFLCCGINFYHFLLSKLISNDESRILLLIVVILIQLSAFFNFARNLWRNHTRYVYYILSF